MQVFLNAVVSTVVIGLLTLVGYISGAKHWMGAETKVYISKLLMTIAIPFMCIYGLNTNLNHDMLLGSGRILLVPICCTGISFIMSFLVGKLIRMPKRRLGVFMTMCALSNTMFVGYAMSLELFGSACVPYVMLTYLISSSSTQIIGVSLIRWSGGIEAASKKAMALKLLRSPTILGVVIAFSFVFFDMKVPALVLSFGKYMSNIVSPLAMISTGYIIYEIGLKNIRIDRHLLLMMAFRFLFCPMLTAGLCMLFGVDGLARSVLLVQASMPIVSVAVIAATDYGADEQFAAQGAALTTLASFLVIPILMVII